MYVRATSTRFSRGMSTPAIRAIRSALPLLVLWIGANDHHGPVAADHFAVVATGLHRGSDFQRSSFAGCARLLQPVRDPTPGEVVRGKLHADPVAGQDADEVHPQLP